MKVTTRIDTEIGRRLHKIRLLKGMTQQKLAEKIDISFQQVQKYENGTNRVSSSRLLIIANVLDVPITYFFDDLGSDNVLIEEDDLTGRVIRTARLLNEIPDGVVKDGIFNLIKAITKVR